MTTRVAALLSAGAPLQPGADDARREAQRELARQVYRDAEPGLLQRAWQALLDLVGGLSAPSGGTGLQVAVVVVLVLAVLVVVALLLRGTGLAARRAATAAPGPLTGPASADELRRAARRAAEQGRWDDAVVDGFRALVRALQDRDLVAAAPGLTAAEAARAAAVELPQLAARFDAAARLFDGVLYGDRRAGAEDAAAVAGLDAAAATARPAVGSSVGSSVGSTGVRARP